MSSKWNTFRLTVYGGLLGLVIGFIVEWQLLAEGRHAVRSLVSIAAFVVAGASITGIVVAIRNSLIR